MRLQNRMCETVDYGMGHMEIWKPIRKAGSNILCSKNLPSMLMKTKKLIKSKLQLYAGIPYM